MNRRPPDDREAKEGSPDEILIAPPEDRDPPDDPPGQKTADPKVDPTSSKSKKKAPSRKRYRLEQDPGGPVEAPGETSHLDSEAPMNALSPTRAKKATSTKAATTKAALPQRVTKPEVQRHHNLSATVVRGPKVEHGEVRWYWRIDRCANPALGVTKRETIYHKWATVEQAQSELADLVIRGAHRPQVAAGGRRIVTFADLIDADAAAEGEPAHLSPATLLRRETRRRCLTKLLGHKAIVQTSKDELERIFLGTIAGRRTHLSVKKDSELLVRAWRWAFEASLVAVKPPKLELGRSKREPKKPPNRAQINAIIQALDGEERLIVEVLASTGARIGEVITLRSCDYDPCSHRLSVNGKTGPRWIPIDETLRGRLAERAGRAAEALFRWPSDCITLYSRTKRVRVALARACHRLELPSFTPHSLRRAAVNFFIDHGYDPKVLAVLLGHSVTVMMEYYRTPTPEQIERLVATARPGDFSETSSTQRRALNILPELLKDEALMADGPVRDAVTLLLNSLGKALGDKREPSPAPAGQGEATASVVHRDALPARPLATSTPPTGRAAPRSPSEPRAAHAPTPIQRGDTPTPAPAQPPLRPVVAAAPFAAPPPSAKRSPSPAPPSSGAATPHYAAPARAHREGAAPPPGQRATLHRTPPANARPQPQPQPSGELEARREPTRGPPRALTDKLTKG